MTVCLGHLKGMLCPVDKNGDGKTGVVTSFSSVFLASLLAAGEPLEGLAGGGVLPVFSPYFYGNRLLSFIHRLILLSI